MKDLAVKAFKFIGASIGVLVAAYTIGWSGAWTLHNLFKTERAEAQAFVVDKLHETEDKWNKVREADLDGIHGKMDILIDQNKLIISQNYRTRKAIESRNP
jgi:hypothetical protein